MLATFASLRVLAAIGNGSRRFGFLDWLLARHRCGAGNGGVAFLSRHDNAAQPQFMRL